MNMQTTIPKSLLHFANWQNQIEVATPPPNQRQHRIVIAEDDPTLRDLFGKMLNSLGYSVRCAEDGNAAWQSLRAEPFDLLITDFEMPNLNGLDLVRRMRVDLMQHPIILISGNMPEITAEIQELLLPGAALSKPFSFSDLIPAVEALLQDADASAYIASNRSK